jgi:glutathione synthase/RimK-type ligase-like ATP-grasp enzyme
MKGIYIGERRSSFAFDLARTRGLKILRRVPAAYVRKGGTIINWGSTDQYPLYRVVRWINRPSAVRRASDKREFFAAMRDNQNVVEATELRSVAETWREQGHVVVARTLTRSSGGAGIQLVTPQNTGPMPVAPLYTKYFNAAREYRVHVIHEHTLVQQKRRRNGVEPVNQHIRNAGPEWVFCVDNVTPPTAALVAECSAVVCELGLDFGAVDVRQKRDGSFKILEVNTAPGIEGTSLQFYAENLLDRV